jgi:hypothetical protein
MGRIALLGRIVLRGRVVLRQSLTAARFESDEQGCQRASCVNRPGFAGGRLV